jgi:SAM-dependent methyltransferase
MSEKAPRTGGVNGRLWNVQARDWANIQEGQVRAAIETVLERAGVGSGTRYLDVGCGAGLALQLAAIAGADVAGIDAASALLEIARERVPAGQFHLGDLEELPLKAETFDLVTGFNSFQFAANPAIALAEARRVVRPGGRVVVVTWGQPEGMEAVALLDVLRPLLPPPPLGSPGPFALSDEATLRALAARAHLSPVSVFDVECPFFYPDQDTAVRGLNSAGAAVWAMEHTNERVVTAAHARALSPFRRPDGSYQIRASFRCMFAMPAMGYAR